MRKINLISLFSAFCLLTLSCAEKQNDPVAVCENGRFVGYVEDNGVLAFKGIPFAKAPVGELRWKAPQPVEASDEVFEAKEFRVPGLQSYDEGEPASHGELSEDCLYLNVWTTDLEMKAGRPVMVWIHGGSYGWGGTIDPLYEGKYLPAEYPDVVLVSVEYRVNAMGFIDFSNVPGGEAFPDTPYLGILDQQQALRWIQKNISAFGGDPDNVTIFGESAGGGSMCCHLIAKGSEGLFRRVIPMSGDIYLEHTPENYAANGQAEKLLAATGCKDMDGLMALSEAELLKGLNTDAGVKSFEGYDSKVGAFNNWPMRSDERSILPTDGYKALLEGKSKDVDVMIGIVADELRYWAHLQFDASNTTDGPLAGYYLWAQGKVDEIKQIGGKETARRIDECMKYIDPDSDEWDAKHPGIWKYTEIMNNYMFRLGSITIAQNHSEAGGSGRTYMYVFGKGYDKESFPEESYIKACHACELTYAFNNLAYKPGAPYDPVLTKRFSNILVNFARTGNPSIDGVDVPEYDKTDRSTIIIGRDSEIHVEQNPLAKETELLLPTFYDYFLKK
ncbi:MAG: carboxylesterase family protein [Bacteroidia bacterium]|nr:carboxylesterase family protein [Bacteroidia bacterium]